MTRAEAAVRRRARRRSRLWVPALLAAVLAAAWLWPDAPQQPPAGHIPQQLLDLAERNPEARTFVYDYPEQHDACHAIDLTAEASSETVPLLPVRRRLLRPDGLRAHVPVHGRPVPDR